MTSFWKSSRFTKPATGSRSRCPDILGFLGVAFDEQNTPQRGLHPLTTDTSPKFADVSMNGASFDVRKVAVNTLPTGLADDLLKSRDFVVVKQPRLESFETENRDALDEIATELEVLRHQPLRNHENIIDLIGIAYHNAGDAGEPNIIPALVIEYAEFGNLAAYQADGNGREINDKIDICSDAAQGLKVLHDSGVIHGDFKASNLLVCRHESRKFIVKVSDFGFCLSTHDHNIHLTGFTRYLDAPEAEDAESVDPRFLVQLDIYSYGLFLYSVFKNGTDYFEAIPEAKREEYAKKVKKTPLLPRLLQLNLLHTMANERCMLRRFHNMGNIVQLIRAAKPSDPNSDGHEREPIYQPRKFTIEGFHQTRNHLSSWYRKLISEYVVSLGGDEELLSPLKDEFIKRAELEIDLFHGRLEPNADHFMFVPVHNLCVMADTLGLLPQQPHAGTDEPSSKEQKGGNTTLSYYRSLIPTLPDQGEVREEKEESWEWRPSTTDMPDFRRIHNVLVKLPESGQQCLATKLEEIAEMDGELNRRALALFNLSYAYVNEIGVKMDLVRAKFLLLESANTGLHSAQDAYISLFLHSTEDNEADPKDRSLECLPWIRTAAQRGNKRALVLLRSQVPLVAQDARKSWCLNQTFAAPAPRGHDFEDLQIEERSDVLDWIQWRSSFLRFAAQNNLFGMAKLIAEVDNSVLDQTNHEGQTALLLACRAGNIQISRFLIMEGASTSKGDVKRVTPLHWLSSFEGDDKALMANMLAEKEADPNSWAVSGRDNSTGPGTPLHWAVEQNDIVAAQLLVQIGSDPLCRSSEDGTWNPFQLACRLAHSCIVQYFLQLPAVASFASQHNAWGRSASTINHLFCVLGGDSRWDRLVRHGKRFEIETKETLQSLVENGADLSCVLRTGELKMAAPFAVANHGCNHDLMSSGLEFGFKPFIECRFGRAGSGATPLFMAITDRHYEMVKILLENGANIHAPDAFNMTPLHRAAKETDNIDYLKILLEKGAMLDDPVPVTPFWVAVYSGNLRIAKYLYDLGADRDFMNPETHRTALGELIWMRTRNAARRVKFLLALPDRNSSDGSVVFKMDQDREIDALHLAVVAFSEDPDVAEVTRLMITYLLEKYGGEEYLNSTKGAHRATCLSSAVEEGNFKVVRLLLAAGLDPNIPDEYGRTPLDHLLWRHCYPASLDIFQTVDITNQFQVSRLLSLVNRNTSEVYSLLLSYSAKSRVFKFPTWYQDHPGYRNLDWVMERLKEKREAPPVKGSTPYWGGLQITIPERPMQTYEPTSETMANTDGADATSAAEE